MSAGIRFGVEWSDAVIIGADFKQGKLFYQGRQQGPAFNGDTDEELRAKAKAQKAKLIAECGPVASCIYGADAWELRIYD